MEEAGLRVCFIASSQFPIREPFAGGLEAFTHGVVKKLMARGHTVTLFAAEGSDPALSAEVLVPELFNSSEAGRRDVTAMPEEWMQQHHAYLGLMLRLARAREFDVIHNNSLHHLPLALSSLVRTPIVTTLHTPPTPWLESAAAFCSPSASFAAVSSATAQAWSPVLDTTVISNGVDTNVWQPGPGGPDCVWTGRMVKEKAPHVAIDAARAAGFRIALAGPVMDENYFSSEVVPRLGEGASYYGHLTQEQLRALVGHSAVAVVSSMWEEPYGLVAAEALACGTPVAAFPRGGLVEVVGQDAGVLATHGTVEALARAIRATASLDRTKVRAYAVEHHSLDRTVSDYEALYRRAATAVTGGLPV